MLKPQDYISAATRIGCSVAAIKAVTRTESGQQGFFGNGKVIIKFEGHIFHAFTKGKYDDTHPTLSYPKWTEKYSPAHSIDQYIRFDQAYALDPNAAMMATSWGMFQIMGENYSSCGYSSVNGFVSSMHQSEAMQIYIFCAYVKTQGLAKWLVLFDTAPEAAATGFSLHYNGTGYKLNHYDTIMLGHYHEALAESA